MLSPLVDWKARLWGRRTTAQGSVEFAVVISVFFLLLLGVVEFGYALYTQSSLGQAASDGARRGMVLTRVDDAFTRDGNRPGTYPGLSTCNRDTIVGTVRCQIGAVDVGRTTAILDTPSGGGRVIPGLKVEVKLQHQYRPLIVGFFPLMDGIVMTGSAEMRTQ